MQRCPKCGWTGQAPTCARCGTATAQSVEPAPSSWLRLVVLLALVVGLPALGLAGFVAWYHATQGVRVDALADSPSAKAFQRCRREVCPGGKPALLPGETEPNFRLRAQQTGCAEACR